MTKLTTIAGTKVLALSADGPLLQTEANANDVIGEGWSAGADLVAIPAERLGPDFLKLETRTAGAVFQKFVNCHLRCAVVGDVSSALECSKALRDFVHETNKGNSVWFIEDFDRLRLKLEGGQR